MPCIFGINLGRCSPAAFGLLASNLDNSCNHQQPIFSRTLLGVMAMGLQQRMEEILQHGLQLPCWDWKSDADWRGFVGYFYEVIRELIDHFASHPEELQRLHWRRFEELIAAVFRNHGFETVLGTGSHDQGVDLRLSRRARHNNEVSLGRL
ncbi:MAG: restriction endonuclease [Deltaproteobacteria bacterium]|nr:restriction endonuclease [Deltaproteobacteria bacterium]